MKVDNSLQHASIEPGLNTSEFRNYIGLMMLASAITVYVMDTEKVG